MDKASKAIRRSSIRLKSFSSGHQDLHLVLSGLRDVRSSAKSLMTAQMTASQDLLRWSHTNELKAMQDTFLQFAELSNLWTETQREFIDKFKSFIRQFEMILEGEQQVDQVRNNVTTCERRESRIRKDLKQAARKSDDEQVRQLEIKLAQAERTKDLAKLEVLDRVKENESVKLIRVKVGILKLSESYVKMSTKCGIIHNASKDIASLLPDPQDKLMHEIEYQGSAEADRIVATAKDLVRQQDLTNPVSPTAPNLNELPPPYSPNAHSVPFRSPPQTYHSTQPSSNPFDTPERRRSSTSNHQTSRSPYEFQWHQHLNHNGGNDGL